MIHLEVDYPTRRVLVYRQTGTDEDGCALFESSKGETMPVVEGQTPPLWRVLYFSTIETMGEVGTLVPPPSLFGASSFGAP